MPDNESWSSSTVGISTGYSFGLLQTLGLVPDTGIPGAGSSVSVVFSNGVNPSDSAIIQFIDQLFPDEVSLMVSTSVEGGIGLGGHYALEMSLYPTYSVADLVQNDTTSVTGMAYGYGVSGVSDQEGIVGGRVLIGPGLGVEVAASGPSVAIGFNLENGLVLHMSSGSYFFNIWSFRFEEIASDSLDTALSAAQGWTRHDQGGASGGGNGGSGGGSGGDDSGSGAGATGGDAITTGNELSVDAGIVAPVANPPGTWSGGGTGTPNPGLPINPDYVGIQPIILDLHGDGVEVNAANGGWAREALRLAA